MLKGRYIRRLSAIVCFAFCALAVILWIRSYRWLDHADICYAANQSVAMGGEQYPAYRYVSANTSLGILTFRVDPAHIVPNDLAHETTGVHYHSREAREYEWWKRNAKFGFGYRSLRRFHDVAVPFWFLILLAAAVGALLWKDRPYRFTLRGALVATTLIAIVLGIGVALSR